MPSDTTDGLHHLTINTRHLHWSPRAEVSDEVIVRLHAHVAALASGECHAVIPDVDGYHARGSVANDVLMVTVFGAAGVPLVTFAVVPKTHDVGDIWRVMTRNTEDTSQSPPLLSKEAASCLVRIQKTAILDPAAFSWLGDYERCVAWTWLFHLTGVRGTG